PFISPVEVEQGKIVTIKVKATNDSPFDITYPLAVKVNGTAVGTAKQLSLGPAESEDIVLTVTAQTAGNNDVTVGNLQGFFTVKGGSFLDMFPWYIWAFFGIILGVIILMIVLLVLKPSRKGKAGAQTAPGQKQLKGKGKAGQPGGPEAFPFPGQMQRPGMPGMPGMPEGMQMGMQGPGQSGAPFDMSSPGGQQPGQPLPAMGMQSPFQSQPGMQQQLPHQAQPGMGPSSPQGMHIPFMQGQQFPQGPQGPQFPQGPQGTQFPQAPHMPQAGQQLPGQPLAQGMPQQPGHGMPPGMPQQPGHGMPPGMPQQPGHGMPPGMPQQPGHGMPPPISGAPFGQPGMPFGSQPPAPPVPHMQSQPGPGMPQAPHAAGQPPMPAMGPQGMYPPMQHGAQQAAPFQQMGMPKFTVSNLTITPNHVKVGEPVNVSIIVSNNGAQMGKYSVVLRIGGVVENITDMTLTPGASQTASFVVVKDAPGDYYADIDGLGGFFTVIPLTPPSFTVSNFSISPERVRQGQPVIITASVTNTGEITGSHPLILRIKGIAEAQHDVSLAPGKTQDVEFQIVKDTPGFYPVSMENWTGKFVVEMDWTG
ncbi:MAG: hypothetical protein PHU70_07215, partial [Dehalococcoidia bacterium]|nr:hypothetical protein [Dehalococcoidia bacterium]